MELKQHLYRGVASMSRHHLEAQAKGTCTPQGGADGDGFPAHHSRGATETSCYTSWTEKRSVAEGYARSSPTGSGVVLEIDFRDQVAIKNHYVYQGEINSEAEYLISGIISGVRVTPMKRT